MALSCRRRYAWRIRRAKRFAYPRRAPDDWTSQGYARTKLVERLSATVQDTFARTAVQDGVDLSERLEWACEPVVFTGLTREWAAAQSWSVEQWVDRFGSERFKVGKDVGGAAVFVRMKDYARYMTREGRVDDSPLYLFDASFGERPHTSALSGEFSSPPCFGADVLALLGDHPLRPPHRWVVLGPARSGTGIHIDPLGTSAWNALLQGTKCWALFPPGVPKDVVRPQRAGREAADWWAHVYPSLRDAVEPERRPRTLIQRAGETVFVPGGWWHVVLNLDTTLAVTQNFCACSCPSFDRVWRRCRLARPALAAALGERLEGAEPALHARAAELDASLEAEPPPPCSDSSSASESESESGDEPADGGEGGGGGRTLTPERRQAALWRRLKARHPAMTWRPAAAAVQHMRTSHVPAADSRGVVPGCVSSYNERR